MHAAMAPGPKEEPVKVSTQPAANMKRVLRFFLASTANCAVLTSCALDGRVDFSAEGDFSVSAILRGVKATKAQCEQVENTVWASTKDHGSEWLRYWVAGFREKTTDCAVVFFHGDLDAREGQTSKSYLTATNESLQDDTEMWSRRLDAPYIFIGRPGTHGSSGDHTQRRRRACHLFAHYLPGRYCLRDTKVCTVLASPAMDVTGIEKKTRPDTPTPTSRQNTFARTRSMKSFAYSCWATPLTAMWSGPRRRSWQQGWSKPGSQSR
jgi:hypothetical protein